MRERVRRVAAAGVAALALVVGAGCSATPGSDDGAGASTPAPTPGTGSSGGVSTPPATSTPAVHRYVALGDSYTAAPLVPKTQLHDGCLRSSGNYPSRVARALPGSRLVDVSCSGADTGSMTRPQRIGDARIPPQLGALSRRTDLVTLGIGGNDLDVFGTLVGTCTRLRSTDPTGSPCRDQLGDRLRSDLPQVRDRVAGVVAAIRARAPHARVVVVGYPQIVPAHGSCPRRLPLAAGDYPWARLVNAGLDAAVRAGARRADAFVDAFAATRGHDVCSARPWINGQVTEVNRALAYHPFAAEQAAVARLVIAALPR